MGWYKQWTQGTKVYQLANNNLWNYTWVKIYIFKIITWNRDHKKRKETRSCRLLSDANKQGSNKPARFTILEVLRYVKATCNCY